MQSILILKTPGGQCVGHVRISGGNGSFSACITGEKKGAVRVVAMDESSCAALKTDASGRVCIPFLPYALVIEDEQGGIAAVGAQSGRQAEAMMRVQRHLSRAGKTDSVQPKKNEETAELLHEERGEAAEKQPEEVEIPEQPEISEETDENAEWERAKKTLPDPFAAQRAWPPPPFFPAARFKDGAWRS